MVPVTRLNGSQFYVSAEMIKFIEARPDTVITLTDGEKLVVRETPAVVVQAIIAYRRQIYADRLGAHGESA